MWSSLRVRPARPAMNRDGAAELPEAMVGGGGGRGDWRLDGLLK
jgi:hypothetical protein